MSNGLNKTVLNPVHSACGGNMVDFGGWEMPLWYQTGAIREHIAVITAAGLFDTSHMAVILAQGSGVRTFLNYAITKDINELKPSRAAYGIILDSDGSAVDDALIYAFPNERFALVVNAGMGAKVINHMKTFPDSETIQWTDLTSKISKIDLQGPFAYKIIRRLVANSESGFDKFPYFSFQGEFEFDKSAVHLIDGTPILLSRTGYTGEQGFEIFLPNEKVVAVWNMILDAGKNDGLIPCGLAARDSLRTGAVLPLSHQDIGPWPFINNPWSFALPMDNEGKFTKKFNGVEALNPDTALHTFPFLGYDPRKVEPHEAVVMYENREIGKVLTSVADMAIGRIDGKIMCINDPAKPVDWNPKGLVCGFIKINEKLASGTIVHLKDSRRSLKVEIVTDIRPNRTARKALA